MHAAVPLAASAALYRATLLHPPGFAGSFAVGASAGVQGGAGCGDATGGESHAFLWMGSAASVIDLNPADFKWSYVEAISDGQQVGGAGGDSTGNSTHAFLWAGSSCQRG